MKQFIFLLVIFLFSCQTQENVDSNHSSENQLLENTKNTSNTSLQDGDLIFHTSRSSQSKAIQIATNSKYSHMGMIYREVDEYYVYEAVQPVKVTPLQEWIDRGVDGKYVIKRVFNSSNFLTTEGIAKMKRVGQQYLGKDYDLQFLWSDDKIYCSELVWKIYKETFNIEIGQLQQLKEFDLSNEAVQTKVKERYGQKIPKEEWVISPDQMFKANNLITIIEH